MVRLLLHGGHVHHFMLMLGHFPLFLFAAWRHSAVPLLAACGCSAHDQNRHGDARKGYSAGQFLHDFFSLSFLKVAVDAGSADPTATLAATRARVCSFLNTRVP